MRIGTNFKIIRTNRGLSQRQLGKLARIRHQDISLMEAGRFLPTDLELEDLCIILKVTPSMLYPNDAQREALSETNR